MRTFTVSLLTPETGKLLECVESLVVPVEDGLMGILAGHMPLVASLGGGVMKVVAEGDTHYWVVGAGLVEVTDDRVVVMADTMIPATSQADAEDRWDAYLHTLREPALVADGLAG